MRDINFSNDGRRFPSSSYDKVIKLWDTETGQVIRSLGEGKMFFTAKFHPDDDKQNVLMAGCQDKKVYQWDMNSGDLVQVCTNASPAHHLILIQTNPLRLTQDTSTRGTLIMYARCIISVSTSACWPMLFGFMFTFSTHLI